MAKFNAEYLFDLKNQYIDICNLETQEQAERFKLRYVLSIGEDILSIDDRLGMFLDDSGGIPFFEFNDPKLSKFLEKCQVDFDSFLVRNQELSIFAPVESSTKLCFVQFLLHCYKEKILEDYFKRWKLSAKSRRVVLKNKKHIAQAVLSEFIEQPPFGVDKELDKLTKQERQTKVRHEEEIAALEAVMKKADGKAVKSVKEIQAKQQYAILMQTNVEDEIGFIRTQINKRARGVLKRQKEMLTAVYSGLKVTYAPVQTQKEKEENYVLPEGWEEFIDDNTGAPYYYNASANVTQWNKP